jgi:hypothetical protein
MLRLVAGDGDMELKLLGALFETSKIPTSNLKNQNQDVANEFYQCVIF